MFGRCLVYFCVLDVCLTSWVGMNCPCYSYFVLHKSLGAACKDGYRNNLHTIYFIVWCYLFIFICVSLLPVLLYKFAINMSYSQKNTNTNTNTNAVNLKNNFWPTVHFYKYSNKTKKNFWSDWISYVNIGMLCKQGLNCLLLLLSLIYVL